MEFVTRFKNALVLIAVLLAQALALAVQVRSPVDEGEPDGRDVRLIRLWGAATVAPFERAAHAIGSGVRSGWANYVDLRHVREQNQMLQGELTRMRVDEAEIAEDALQGRRLEAMLDFKQHYVASTVAAQVIGASGSEQSRVLTIDKGSHDGLKPDMAVITPDGIVGKLRDVFPGTAQVLEINDPTSGAGVILESTRIRAILRGTVTGRAQIGNLTYDSRIKPGETVLTSGGDQVFPRGLQVGTIESIAPDPDHQPYTAIVVRPAVDLGRVEEVLVITGTQTNLTAPAQQDLAAAEVKHAADLSAERLPGIHDDQAAPGSAASEVVGAAGKPVPPPIPKPLPVVHPDRFSSGATPPASALTPGAPHAGQVTIQPGAEGASATEPPAAAEPRSNPDAGVASERKTKPAPPPASPQ